MGEFPRTKWKLLVGNIIELNDGFSSKPCLITGNPWLVLLETVKTYYQRVCFKHIYAMLVYC